MNKIIFGDNREIMAELIKQNVKVQTCITSPPYYGLRDYGCDGQLGLESSPEEYIENMVDVFRHVRELLSDDGTLWLNIGDSYAGAPSEYKNAGSFGKHSFVTKKIQSGIPNEGRRNRNLMMQDSGIKQKDLIGIPWMLAFALRSDGWYLRQDIIWNKPNPMPESVKDRCTKAHEYIFLLSKSPKYFYDHESIKEVAVTSVKQHSFKRNSNTCPSPIHPAQHRNDRKEMEHSGKRNKRSVWTVSKKPYHGAHFAVFPEELIEDCVLAGSKPGDLVFDPFMGSGTTAAVALKHERRYLGIELNKSNEPLQKARLDKVSEELGKQRMQKDLFDECWYLMK